MEGRSIWTGRRGGSLVSVRIDTRKLLGGDLTSEELLVEPEHEAELRDFIAFVEQSLKKFWTFFLIGVVLVVTGSFLGAAWRSAIWLVVAGMVVLGATTIRFPFTTPQTIRLFGLHPSIRIARVLGVAQLFLAAWSATLTR